MTDDNIHWFSIINSVTIVFFLTGIVGLIMARILRKDFARYNEESLSAEERAEANREMKEVPQNPQPSTFNPQPTMR